MSLDEEQLMERLRRTYDAFNSGDFDVAIRQAHPEVVLVRPGAQSDLTGADALRAWMEPDAFEHQHIEPIEFRVAGDKVLVRQRITARGAGSGIEMETSMITIWTFDDEDRVTRLENFFDHEEAEALSRLETD